MCCFFEFEADDGRLYCIAGTSNQAILSATNGGVEPGEGFSLFADAGIKKFIRFEEVTEQYVLENYPCSHYVDMAKGLVSGSLDAKVLWIGRSKKLVQPTTGSS